jgi:hypothetical protein
MKFRLKIKGSFSKFENKILPNVISIWILKRIQT